MYFHQLFGLRYGKTGCVEELCFHSSKTVPYWIVPIFRRLAFFGNPLKSDTWPWLGFWSLEVASTTKPQGPLFLFFVPFLH